jgi:hypothetical protein
MRVVQLHYQRVFTTVAVSVLCLMVIISRLPVDEHQPKWQGNFTVRLVLPKILTFICVERPALGRAPVIQLVVQSNRAADPTGACGD